MYTAAYGHAGRVARTKGGRRVVTFLCSLTQAAMVCGIPGFLSPINEEWTRNVQKTLSDSP